MDRMELIEVLEQLLLTRFVVEQTWDDYIIYKFRHRFYKDYVYQHLSMGKDGSGTMPSRDFTKIRRMGNDGWSRFRLRYGNMNTADIRKRQILCRNLQNNI